MKVAVSPRDPKSSPIKSCINSPFHAIFNTETMEEFFGWLVGCFFMASSVLSDCHPALWLFSKYCEVCTSSHICQPHNVTTTAYKICEHKADNLCLVHNIDNAKQFSQRMTKVELGI